MCEALPLGYIVQINDQDEGLLFKNDVYQSLERGEEVKGYIKQVREDGKIDVSLRPQGFRNVIDPDCDTILSVLKEKKCFISPTRVAQNLFEKAYK